MKEVTYITYCSPPDNLAPALVGGLVRQSADLSCILATIFDLEKREYLKIKERENNLLFHSQKEYLFEKLKSETNLRPFEQKVIRAIFKRKNIVSSFDLKNQFYKEVPDITREIDKEVKKVVGKREEIKQKILGFKRYLDDTKEVSDFFSYALVLGAGRRLNSKDILLARSIFKIIRFRGTRFNLC